MKKFILQMVVTAFAVTFLCPSAQGSAKDKDLNQEIAKKQEVIENVLRVRRYYQEIVKDPDTVVIDSFPIFPGAPALITKSREGLKSTLRMAYFLYLAEKKKFFDQDEYTQWVNQTMAHYLKESAQHKDDLRSGTIPRLNHLIKQLEKEITALQEERRRKSQGQKEPRGLKQPEPTASPPLQKKTCVELVGISRHGKPGWNLAESAHVEGNLHWISKQYRSPRGWDGDVKVTWTEPPERICEGDSFTIKMEGSNFKLHPEDPKAAVLFMTMDTDPTRMLLEKKVCSNPLPWDPKSGVHLTASESQESNECTFKVRSIVGPRDTPECRLRAYVEAGPWYGTVCYNYKVIKE